jgi:KipI family sensor histidine kinase inhibitor
LLPAGDTALVVEFGDSIDQRLNARVLALARRLNESKLDGIVETVPTFRSLMVHFDPLVLPATRLSAHIADLLQRPAQPEPTTRVWHLPVCYDASVAPDLELVASKLNLSPPAVIERHCSVTYHVYMLGFLPGQAYMGDLPPDLVLPRRETPRLKIPAGSVAIAMSMTSIFPMETPCGWHIVGRSPISLFEISPMPRTLLGPGDKVCFTPVSQREFDHLLAQVSAGTFRPQPETARVAA